MDPYNFGRKKFQTILVSVNIVGWNIKNINLYMCYNKFTIIRKWKFVDARNFYCTFILYLALLIKSHLGLFKCELSSWKKLKKHIKQVKVLEKCSSSTQVCKNTWKCAAGERSPRCSTLAVCWCWRPPSCIHYFSEILNIKWYLLMDQFKQ